MPFEHPLGPRLEPIATSKRRARRPWAALGLASLLGPLALGCPGPSDEPIDAAVTDAHVDEDAPEPTTPDSGTPIVATTDHCTYEAMPGVGRAGGSVVSGPLTVGVAEGFLAGPVSTTLGAYTARAENIGGQGFHDARREPVAGAFATSVGVEARPRVRAIALSTGQDTPDTDDDETLILVKIDLGVGYQGLVHELERALGPEYAGKVIVTTSHSHNTWGNYSGNAAMQVGFSQFRRIVFDRMVADMAEVARRALDARVPARIGIGFEPDFDPGNQVSRDRRSENDRFAGGPEKDHRLYVIRVDTLDGEPLAALPMFGMHGTLLDADNVIATTDAPGAIERIIEEQFTRDASSSLPPVLVMHLQGAGGDVSPVGRSSTDCPERSTHPYCQDFAEIETVGWAARDAIMATYALAGESMTDVVALEGLSSSFERGPNWENFTVREGALRYAPFDGLRPADRLVWADDDHTELLSPIDEFNAPLGAALCGAAQTAFFSAAQMPNTARMEESYAGCNQLTPRFIRFFETALGAQIGTTPVCDTTRTTITAFRIQGDDTFGRFVVSALPGEPTTLLANRMRMLAQRVDPGLTDDRFLILGYSQDNNGYLLTAEDWVSNGYEPNITFWGPLDAEMIVERAVALLPAVLSDEREDTYAGQTHVAVPSPVEDFTADESTASGFEPGTIPAASPSYLATQAGVDTPAQLAEGASIPRLGTVFFTWIGAHPLHGTPQVRIEHRADASAAWSVVTRRSGRAVLDADFILTWTPDPLESPAAGDPPRVHYWTVQWQAVPALGEPGLEALSDRLGLPVGQYRFVVEVPDGAGLLGTTQYLVAREFEVTPATLAVDVERGGAEATIRVTAHAADGFRLLDREAGANRPIPLRGATVHVEFAGGGSTDVTLSEDGRATFTAPAGALTVTDAFGNTGTGG